jgi:cytochrome c556
MEIPHIRHFVWAAAGAFVLLAPAITYAQLSPANAIVARVNGYRDNGTAFKNLNDQLKSNQPAKAMLKYSTRQILSTAKMQYSWFPAGSGPGPGIKTKAKANIWSDSAAFGQMQKKFEAEANLLAKAVDGGDIPSIQRQAKAVGLSCKACHTQFRAED